MRLRSESSERPRSPWKAILGDVQFWAPFGVLLLGLLVLALIQ
ncbi:MAG TPA: hypothetical protein VLT57_13805 [Bryobacteraceae bacterium]|nr:hypothetical protein [Bryobacteraceae bacterium]